jgi:rod shape-determining protein MreC
MGGLFVFLYRIRQLLVFLGLEALCIYLIVTNNAFQGVVWLHSSNAMVASTMEMNNKVVGYFDLADQNAKLAAENAILKQVLSKRELQLQGMVVDTLTNKLLDTLGGSMTNKYKYRVAKAINNTVSFVNNYITIDKGTADGVRPGMGVVSPTGIVGKVLLCSEHYSTVNSLLHSSFTPAVAISGSNATGNLQWKGNDPKVINLEFIARHLKPKIGDTVLTSSTSDIFPAGLPVGRIKKVNLRENDTFYEIEVDLATDFSTLGYVYLIDNTLAKEKNELEDETRQRYGSAKDSRPISDINKAPAPVKP